MATVSESGRYLLTARGTSTAAQDILDANKGTLATGFTVKSLSLVVDTDCTITLNNKYPGTLKAGVVAKWNEDDKISSVKITEAGVGYQLTGTLHGDYTYTA